MSSEKATRWILEAEVNEKGHVLTLQSDFVDHPGLSEQVDDVYPAQTL